MDNRRISVECVSAIHAFDMFYTVYPISLPVTYVRVQPNVLVTILVLDNVMSCTKITAWSVAGLVIVHKLRGLLSIEFIIDCKY